MIERCIECGEEVDVHHDDYEWTEDGVLCWGCYEVECEHASTLLHFSVEGKQVIKVGDHICEDAECGGAVDLDTLPVGKRVWHSTGGWRGYYQSPVKDGYVVLTEGWATGYPDETTSRKVKLFNLVEWLEQEGEYAPRQGLWILIEPTSNIFSQSMTILCAEADVEDICEWLEEAGFCVEVLHRALG